MFTKHRLAAARKELLVDWASYRTQFYKTNIPRLHKPQFNEIVLSNDEVERICSLLINNEGNISKQELLSNGTFTMKH